MPFIEKDRKLSENVLHHTPFHETTTS